MYQIEALTGPAGDEADGLALNGGSGVAGAFFTPASLGAIWIGGSPPNYVMPTESDSLLYGINDAGDAAGVTDWSDSPRQHAVVVTAGKPKDLSSLVGQGSLATGINNSGRVCGWAWSTSKAFLYDSASNAVIAQINPVAGAANCFATALNALSQVVGTCDNNHGFFYDGGSLTDLGPAAFVEDVNASGKVCGSIGKPWPQAFSPGTWDVSRGAPAFTEIPVPPGFLGGHASGINSKGDIVGTCWTPQTYDINQSAYIYTGGVSTDLNGLIPQGGHDQWHLEFAEAINDKGQICGSGRLNGKEVGFLLTPQPPSSPFGHVTVPELVAILILGGVIYGGSGIVILPGGGPPIHVGPWERTWEMLSTDKRDALIGLALDQLAQQVENREAREAVRRATLTVVRSSIDRLIADAHLGAPTQRMMATPVISKRRVALTSGKLAASLARFGDGPRK